MTCQKPFIVAAHTQAATYILAERAADLIKETLTGEMEFLSKSVLGVDFFRVRCIRMGFLE